MEWQFSNGRLVIFIKKGSIMIKLKNILFEQVAKNDDQINPKSVTGKLIKGITGTDPWEYYLHNANQKWYTKRQVNNKWLDMKARLIAKFGDKKGLSNYELAVSRLNKWISDEAAAAAAGMSIVDTYVDPSALQKIETLKTIPTDSTVVINKIFAKDLTVPTENVEFDDKWIEVRAKRNPEVKIIAKTPQMDYLRVILPHRGLRTNVEAWVNVNDFDIFKTDSGFIGKPNNRSGNTFEIYKTKQKDIDSDNTSTNNPIITV